MRSNHIGCLSMKHSTQFQLNFTIVSYFHSFFSSFFLLNSIWVYSKHKHQAEISFKLLLEKVSSSVTS